MNKLATKKYQIRKARPGDLLALHNISLKTWLDTYPDPEFNITADDIRYMYAKALAPEKIQERKNKLAHPGKNQINLIVEDNNHAIALCTAIQTETHNQLKSIYILPKYQRLGLGNKLWQKVQKIFDPKKDTIVRVASYNDKAINFYKKLGFKSKRKIYFDKRFTMRNGAIIPEIEMIIRKSKN